LELTTPILREQEPGPKCRTDGKGNFPKRHFNGRELVGSYIQRNDKTRKQKQHHLKQEEHERPSDVAPGGELWGYNRCPESWALVPNEPDQIQEDAGIQNGR
jgi:hypothetical protein